MTAASLRSQSAKDLAQMARQNGVRGWHSLKKEDLIRALEAIARERPNKSTAASNCGVPSPNGNAGKTPGVGITGYFTPSNAQRNLAELQEKLAMLKNLAHTRGIASLSPTKDDRLVIMVRDPYWLHACWDLSQNSVDRAQAAMGQRWHSAQPTLRLYRTLEAGSSKFEREIAIHGGVSNWYVDVSEPPASFRMEIGYLASDRTFYALARSSTVQTPAAGTSDAIDENWADVAQNVDKIYAMSGGYSVQGTSRELQEMLENRLGRPMGSPMHTRYGNGAGGPSSIELMNLAVDAEVIVYGATSRNAHVTLKGTPVQVRTDGTFSAKLKLPEMRHVIPIVATSADGLEQRTVILAVERNTKVLEPVIRDVTIRKP